MIALASPLAWMYKKKLILVSQKLISPLYKVIPWSALLGYMKLQF